MKKIDKLTIDMLEISDYKCEDIISTQIGLRNYIEYYCNAALGDIVRVDRSHSYIDFGDTDKVEDLILRVCIEIPYYNYCKGYKFGHTGLFWKIHLWDVSEITKYPYSSETVEIMKDLIVSKRFLSFINGIFMDIDKTAKELLISCKIDT